MAIPITRPGKTQLIVNSPVMNAAGILGYGDRYRSMVNLTKLGAIVTNPITYRPRYPARGVRMIPLDAGVLVHTGLPNPGARKVVQEHRESWLKMNVPIVAHLVAASADDIERSLAVFEPLDIIEGIELGLDDDISWQDAANLTRIAVQATDKPIIVRLPLSDAYEIAGAVADQGAGAVVVSAPPRGTARDPRTGKLVGGRVYGPVVKTLTLRMVGNLARRLTDVPIIGAGGIHSPQDARDYIEAGAVAVQVDSVTWVLPRMIEIIARDLGGLVITREKGALADEWFPGMGETEQIKRQSDDDSA